jgi:hypothetical protein
MSPFLQSIPRYTSSVPRLVYPHADEPSRRYLYRQILHHILLLSDHVQQYLVVRLDGQVQPVLAKTVLEAACYVSLAMLPVLDAAGVPAGKKEVILARSCRFNTKAFGSILLGLIRRCFQ